MLLSFLGTSSYTEAEYDFGSEGDGGAAPRLLRGRFASLCMAQVWKPQEIIILATEKAESQNKGEFAREYKEKGLEALPCQFRFERIPEGRTQAEIWSLFQTIVETIPPESEVVIDVTHGFRSLPMIALAAVHYLELVKRIRIKHIWYGAFEQGREGPFPIIDLAAFSDMLGWIWAVRTFRDSGESHPLAEKLTSLQGDLYHTLSKDPGVKTLGEHLRHIGFSLLAVQPHLLWARMPLAIRQLDAVASKVQKEGETAAPTPALAQAKGVGAALLGLLRDELLSLQGQKQTEETHGQPAWNARAQLEFELQLIDRYLTWHKPAQALLLMREWLITWALHKKGEKTGVFLYDGSAGYDEEKRRDIEQELATEKPPSDEELKKVHKLLSQVREKRNALAHAGYNTTARTKSLIDPQRLPEDLRGILKEMRKLLSEA